MQWGGTCSVRVTSHNESYFHQRWVLTAGVGKTIQTHAQVYSEYSCSLVLTEQSTMQCCCTQMYWRSDVGVACCIKTVSSTRVHVDEMKFCASSIRATVPDGGQSGRRIASGCTLDRYVITRRDNLCPKHREEKHTSSHHIRAALVQRKLSLLRVLRTENYRHIKTQSSSVDTWELTTVNKIRLIYNVKMIYNR